MSYLTKVEKWKNYADLDPALKDELYSLNDKQLKEGKTPVFKAKNIDLPHKVDYWQ